MARRRVARRKVGRCCFPVTRYGMTATACLKPVDEATGLGLCWEHSRRARELLKWDRY